MRSLENGVRRRKPLAARLAAMFMLSSPLVGFAQTTWTVDSCSEDNSGDVPTATGTLRFAAANAASGDKIDMSALTCSTISLHTGAIVFNQTDLTVGGPGMDKLTITGMYNGNVEHDRIITHNGGGSLQMYGFSVSNGYVVNLAYQGLARGGCLFSAGGLTLANVDVHDCSTRVNNGFSYGGGIYASKAVTLKYSIVENNLAGATQYGAWGGGVYSKGTFSAKYSTIKGNVARSFNSYVGYGGGISAKGNLTLTHSTVSGNFALAASGGISSYNRYDFAGVTTTITDSTISGNTAYYAAGLYSNLGHVNISNSTIAFNHQAGSGHADITAGVFVQNRGSGSVVTLISTLIAHNTDGNGNGSDFSVRTNATVTGNHNLVRASAVMMPADTMTDCPLLRPLAFNGGPTQTHALFSTSPAIDKGSNPGGRLKQDQRGILSDPKPYPYPRSSGTAPDIGAYEVHQDDVIFDTGFEGCP